MWSGKKENRLRKVDSTEYWKNLWAIRKDLDKSYAELEVKQGLDI